MTTRHSEGPYFSVLQFYPIAVFKSVCIAGLWPEIWHTAFSVRVCKTKQTIITSFWLKPESYQ